MSKYSAVSCLFLAALLFLTACGQKDGLMTDTLKDNTVLIRSDGSMEQYLVETFDKNYYNEEDLTEFAEKAMKEYNDECGEERVSLKWIRMEKKKVSMYLFYTSVEDFMKFNSQDASFMTIAEAKEDGILPETLHPAGKTTEVSVEEAELADEWYLFSVAADTNIQTTGEMKYYQDAVLLNQMSVQAEEGTQAIVIFK